MAPNLTREQIVDSVYEEALRIDPALGLDGALDPLIEVLVRSQGHMPPDEQLMLLRAAAVLGRRVLLDQRPKRRKWFG